MVENQNFEGPEGFDQNLKSMSRRQFLELGWKLTKYGALAVAGKFFYDFYKDVFVDIATACHCLLATPPEFKNMQAEILKDKYDDALLVVHPGYGFLRFPENFANREDYKNYLVNLKKAIENARQNGELVVFLVGAEDMRRGKFVEGLKFSDADFAVVTTSDSPLLMGCIETPEGKYLYQKWSGVPGIFKEKKVKNIHIAGEFKNLCVALTKDLLDPNLKINILENAVYSPK